MEKIVGESYEKIEKELIDLSKEIYDNPELGNQEYIACKLHVELLKKYGFDVEVGYLGVDTGFRATYDTKKEGPTVAFMAEYDALLGLGHGCGHNILGAASTGAGIVCKDLVDSIGGRVVVLGTPAEETNGAKVTYSKDGAFDDVDFAMASHPGNKYTESGSSLALYPIQFTFRGKSAHAAANPDLGINALDAVIATFNNINALREHVRDSARIHGVITDGGNAANIVPDYAQAQFYVRAEDSKYLLELAERVENCARAGALATGASLEMVQYEYMFDDLRTNNTLQKVFSQTLKEIANIDIDIPRSTCGSLDAGNVSYVCPTIHPYFAITEDRNMAAHSIEFREASITDYANENMKHVVKTLAVTAAKVMKDKDLLKDIKEEFSKIER